MFYYFVLFPVCLFWFVNFWHYLSLSCSDKDQSHYCRYHMVIYVCFDCYDYLCLCIYVLAWIVCNFDFLEVVLAIDYFCFYCLNLKSMDVFICSPLSPSLVLYAVYDIYAFLMSLDSYLTSLHYRCTVCAVCKIIIEWFWISVIIIFNLWKLVWIYLVVGVALIFHLFRLRICDLY